MAIRSRLASWWWIYWGLVWRSLGNRLASREFYQRAVLDFTRALLHTPHDANLYYWRGTLYWRELGDAPAAEADLTQAIELAPQKVARAYLNRAMLRLSAVPPDRDGAAADLAAYLERGTEPYWRSVAQEYLEQLGPK